MTSQLVKQPPASPPLLEELDGLTMPPVVVVSPTPVVALALELLALLALGTGCPRAGPDDGALCEQLAASSSPRLTLNRVPRAWLERIHGVMPAAALPIRAKLWALAPESVPAGGT